jgi:hypothetical protein
MWRWGDATEATHDGGTDRRVRRSANEKKKKERKNEPVCTSHSWAKKRRSSTPLRLPARERFHIPAERREEKWSVAKEKRREEKTNKPKVKEAVYPRA